MNKLFFGHMDKYLNGYHIVAYVPRAWAAVQTQQCSGTWHSFPSPGQVEKSTGIHVTNRGSNIPRAADM